MTTAQKLIQEGVEKGRLETAISLLLKLTKKRFGKASLILEKKLEQSDLDTLDRFGDSFFDFKNIEDAEKWWDDQRFGSA